MSCGKFWSLPKQPKCSSLRESVVTLTASISHDGQCVSLSTVEVLVSPTLHVLDLMIRAMNPILAVAVARFPLPDKIIVPSGPKWNPLTFALEFEVLRHDESWHSKLVVALPREEGPPAAAVTGENAEAGRRVARAVPTGTHHWYLCDESMLVGSRSEELVYSSMVFGGARSAPGAAIQLGIGLPLRMAPKEARNILSLRITSSLSFDTITDTELLAIRYGADKADMSRFHLGESARLAYRRVCNCQELLFRLFHLKPHVMAVWSAFAAQILDTIEHGEARFPGIASNGVIKSGCARAAPSAGRPAREHLLRAPLLCAEDRTLRLVVCIHD
jgi:hypothetical protein